MAAHEPLAILRGIRALIDIAIGALASDFTLLGRILVLMFINIGLALLTPPFDRL